MEKSTVILLNKIKASFEVLFFFSFKLFIQKKHYISKKFTVEFFPFSKNIFFYVFIRIEMLKYQSKLAIKIFYVVCKLFLFVNSVV